MRLSKIIAWLCSTLFCLSLSSEELKLRYAKNFSLSYESWGKKLVVRDSTHGRGASVFTYYLVRHDAEAPREAKKGITFNIPVKRTVMTSTTQLPHMQELGLLDSLVGVANFQYVNTPEVRAMIDQGKIKETGRGPALNPEVLASTGADLIVASVMASSEQDAYSKLLRLKLPVVLTSSYLEQHPLARAEWIKFTAAFFDKEAEAEKIFKSIEKRYLDMARVAAQVKDRPTVFLNVPWGSTWYMPSGISYKAHMLHDAGALYIWSDDESPASLPLDFEAVFMRAHNAEFWLDTSSYRSQKSLIGVDSRYALFKAMKQGRVYNNDLRINQYGGNDYWERGSVHPDEVLADLIAIFHPELLPNHKMVYYRQLPKE